MSLFLTVLFLFIAFGALAVASGFAADAARRITTIPGYEDIKDLESARRWLIIASIVGWITVVVLIILAVIYLATDEETLGAASSFSGLITGGLLFLTLGAVIAVGVLSALAATDINRAKVPDNKLSYRNSVIAAVLSIIVFVLVFIGLIIKLTYKPKSEAEKRAEAQEKAYQQELLSDDTTDNNSSFDEFADLQRLARNE